MSIAHIVREIASRGDESEGYIIALPNTYYLRRNILAELDEVADMDESSLRYQVLFIKKLSNGRGITGGSLENALIYPTYQAAADAAAGWCHTRKPGTRIFRVRRPRPIEIFEDLPCTILDSLAEIDR